MRDDKTRGALLVALRVKGSADARQLEKAVRLASDEFTRTIESAAADRLILKHEKAQKYLLTESGKAQVAEIFRQDQERIGRAILEEIYQRFIELDAEFKRIATDWQVRAPGPPTLLNDHSDPRYDKRVINRLVRVHHRVRGLLETLGQHCERFQSYSARLANSLDNIDNGTVEYFTDPRVDSYHNIWFELHEDLLCTLGRERSE